jgi:acetolactate synthase-1/2/3 large subunit
VTPKAKGFFPESHPLFAGCFTAYGDVPLREAIAQADLVLGVGLDSVDFVTSTWDFETPVINLNLARADDPALKPVIALDGDLRDMLCRLATDEIYQKPRLGGPEHAGSLRQAIARQLHVPTDPPVNNTIPIQKLIEAMQRTLPEESVITVDVGAFKLVFLQQWRTDRPKSLFVANGLSAMGYAIPGALGIRLAQPDRPVVAIVGDGALLMYAGELATVARIGQPLIILVIVDETLSLIRLKQLRQELPIYGTKIGRSDYSALAGAFGLEYRLIDGQTRARAILGEAMELPGPVLVEARITNEDYDRYR